MFIRWHIKRLIFAFFAAILLAFYALKHLLVPNVSERRLIYWSDAVNYGDEDYCTKANDWIYLKNDIYFKQSAAWYFADKNLVQLFFITKFYVNIKLNASLAFGVNKNMLLNQSIGQANIIHIPRWRKDKFYRLYSLQINLNMKSFLKTNSLEKLTYDHLFVFVQYNEYSTELIKLKIKNRYSNNLDRNDRSMICVKNYGLSRDKLKTMRWWLSMNRLIGFNKIVIYNNSIHSDFDSLMTEYNDLVQVKSLQCLPNFINKKGKYLR